jgi:hypothetical protein
MVEVYVEQAKGFEKFHFPCCNPFLDPYTKKEKIQNKIIYIYIYSEEIKNDSSEKRMLERPENSKKLVNEVKKYKD